MDYNAKVEKSEINCTNSVYTSVYSSVHSRYDFDFNFFLLKKMNNNPIIDPATF